MAKTKQHTPDNLVDIFELAELKGRSVRQLRSMLARGQLSHFRLGYRTILFDPAKYEKDIAAFEVKAVSRNGKHMT